MNTKLPVGPDGSRAAPEYCTPERGCYRSALEPPVVYVPPKPLNNLQHEENLEV